MKTLPVLITALASITINRTSAREYTDAELGELYNTPVNLQDFVDAIFALPLADELYVYNYMTDLVRYLATGSKMQTFFYRAIAKMQKEIDDFSARYNLETKPVSDFLIKGIDLQLKILTNAAAKIQSANTQSTDVPITETVHESTPKTNGQHQQLNAKSPPTLNSSQNQYDNMTKSLTSLFNTSPTPASIQSRNSLLETTIRDTQLVARSAPKRLDNLRTGIVENKATKPTPKLLLDRTAMPVPPPLKSPIQPPTLPKSNSNSLADNIVAPIAEKIPSPGPPLNRLPHKPTNGFRSGASKYNKLTSLNTKKWANSPSPASFAI